MFAPVLNIDFEQWKLDEEVREQTKKKRTPKGEKNDKV